MAAGTQPQTAFGWSDDAMELVIEVDPAGAVRLTRLAGGPALATGTPMPGRRAVPSRAAAGGHRAGRRGPGMVGTAVLRVRRRAAHALRGA